MITTMTNEVQVTIRVPADVLERAEELARKLATEVPEYRAFRTTRATVLRLAMLSGLEVLEKRYPGGEVR
jgi:hypothetical protein